MAAPAQHSAEPERLYRIGDVSRLTATKPFVLRFWETEFPMLQPVKTPKGHRLYRQEDIDLILAIKRLLYEEGFTIPGARRHLAEQLAGGTAQPAIVAVPEQRSQPQLFSSAPQDDLLGNGPMTPASVTTAEAPRLDCGHAETLHALREELRAILTLLAAR
jgi:DNA-binding transcriptional MerR regulator